MSDSERKRERKRERKKQTNKQTKKKKREKPPKNNTENNTFYANKPKFSIFFSEFHNISYHLNFSQSAHFPQRSRILSDAQKIGVIMCHFKKHNPRRAIPRHVQTYFKVQKDPK